MTRCFQAHGWPKYVILITLLLYTGFGCSISPPVVIFPLLLHDNGAIILQLSYVNRVGNETPWLNDIVWCVNYIASLFHDNFRGSNTIGNDLPTLGTIILRLSYINDAANEGRNVSSLPFCATSLTYDNHATLV